MTVLDAYAVLAYLRDERAAEVVGELLTAPTILTSVSAAEVLDQLVRIYGQDPDEVIANLLMLSHVGMNLVPISIEAALFAGRLRARHYDRTAMAVSLADCVAAAVALSMPRPLATADPALAQMIRSEGGDIRPLPDTAGRAP